MNKELQFNRDTSRQIKFRHVSQAHTNIISIVLYTLPYVHTEMISNIHLPDPIGLSVGGQKQGIDIARAGGNKSNPIPTSAAIAATAAITIRSRRRLPPAVARSRPYPLLSHAAVENITTTYSSIKKIQSNISGCPNNAFPRWKYSPSRPISYPSYCPRPTPAWPTRYAES